MKLLIIAPEAYAVPSLRGTSVETCIYNIAIALAKNNLVTVVSRRQRRLPHISILGGLRIIRVRGGSPHDYIQRALAAVDGQGYDCIQVDNRPSFLPAVRERFPTTQLNVFLHSLNFITPPKATTKNVAFELQVADQIVVNSESLKSKVKELYPSQGHKVAVVHLAVDSSQFRPPSQDERSRARRQHHTEGTFAIAYAGRLIPLKGIPVLLKAAELVRRQVPNAQLIIAGYTMGRYGAYIKRLAKQVDVPVCFLGLVRGNNMPRFYWAANCFVCPTQGHEAFGLVVIEAMSSGVPTIASANGGICEIITHNTNGLLVSPYSSPQLFAKAIEAIALDSNLAAKLSKEGRRSCVERFTWATTADSLFKLYSRGGHND